MAMGPGKGSADSKEDHNCIFERLRYDLDSISNSFDGSPLLFTFVSRCHNGALCNFYLCKEIYLSTPSTTTNSNIHIMDNPERRNNFGLLAGNANLHAYFGLSCNFQELKLNFNACKKCCKEITKYCEKEGWMDREPYSPKCKQCHGFSIDHLLENGSYQEPLFTPGKHIDISELP